MEKYKTQIIDMYITQNLSTYVIAKNFNTYHQKVTRYLKKWGVKLKSKSDAQKIALDSGRFIHPTKGKKREESVKNKISESMVNAWDKISDSEKQKRSEKAKTNWDNLTETEKKSLQESAHRAIRTSAKEGSKLEKYLYDNLMYYGFQAVFHKKELIPNNKLEVDIFITDKKTAIEIDGPSHFLPIWGEDKLLKTKASDMQKAGLLNGYGYNLIRVKQVVKNVSAFQSKRTLNELMKILNTIEMSEPSQFIEIEIK